MASNKIDLFLATNSKMFPTEKLGLIRERLEALDENRLNIVTSMSYKDPTIMLIFSLFLGSLGVDRFMLGDIGLGVGKLLTWGGCGVWTIIDWFLIMNAAKEKNLEMLLSI